MNAQFVDAAAAAGVEPVELLDASLRGLAASRLLARARS